MHERPPRAPTLPLPGKTSELIFIQSVGAHSSVFVIAGLG